MANSSTDYDKTVNDFSDADWYCLEQSIEDGNVIPIIGPAALEVEFEDEQASGRTVPFYRLVTEDLLKTFQVERRPELLNGTWILHKAVTAILASKSGSGIEQRIRREVSRLVSHYSAKVKPAESLRRLAGIGQFSLFVSLTPDNLLARAMRESRAARQVHVSTFSPRDASESIADLSVLRQGESGVFHLLGSCETTASGFAIHEEDALENLFRLQSDAARRFSNVLAELRRRDKLFIGCDFPDWLGRTMLRLVNDNRLFAKHTQDFLCPSADDPGLSAFLTHYSPNTLTFAGSPGEFIRQLADKLTPVPPVPSGPRASSPVIRLGPTVFVSYASENADAARCIADALLELGFSDVWLDKKKLIGGDDWSDRIEEAIAKCDFFMPVLSREADARREGVYWDEWQTALERARRIKDVYLLPVGIDPEHPSTLRYRRISVGSTAAFFEKHLFHAPGGLFKAEDREALRDRCDHFLETSGD